MLPWVVLALLVTVALLYGAAHAYAGDRLPRGTTIEGVDVGGLRPPAAEQRLQQALADRGPETVPLRAGRVEAVLDAAGAGVRVDAAASVAQVPVATGADPVALWRALQGGMAHEAVVAVDDGLLTERLTELAEQVERPAVEGAVRIQADGPVPTYPRAGRELDVEDARGAVLAALPSPAGPVELAVSKVAPEVTAEEVDRAVAEFAEPAVSAPVTLVAAGGSTATIGPRDFAGTLSLQAEDGRLVPSVDAAGLARRVDAVLPDASVEPRDATVALLDGRPRVVPARGGSAVDADELGAAFLEAVTARTEERTLEVPTVPEEAAVTTGEARGWGVREVVSEFTTYYPHADYRNTNIGRAAALVDGTLLEPGELFSFNETVGERTAENGFTEGFVISNGIFAEDFGGGVSQMATTTFNAAFFAGLEDVEHKPHSFYIDRYPVGREATVAWPTVDLRFRNDTGHGVLIDSAHTPSTPTTSGVVTVRMWSTDVWDVEAVTSGRYDLTSPATRVLTGEDCYPNTGYGGFDVDVTRVFRLAGEDEVHHREVMHTTYTPSDTVICE
ncbi:MAG: Vancomycin B-type resistance protein VanW [uncultured Nocardioidaceae bacterium]|uniref:Vancomycin B-type resistance protein VanW n=1 Tax=uncultured Nocardioidaceae bacterium TaxID=253824 RepID=A0A6J4L4U5_9ACTN|nr:MAG: Vancomycin B-type resistance protein VanW [uncultured Nocardioidaceae bacterium]